MSKDRSPDGQSPHAGPDTSRAEDIRRLTVSYGAFSCTLEGYENPRATVEAIALFFRDLPDAERLLAPPPPYASGPQQAPKPAAPTDPRPKDAASLGADRDAPPKTAPTLAKAENHAALAYERAISPPTSEADLQLRAPTPADPKQSKPEDPVRARASVETQSHLPKHMSMAGNRDSQVKGSAATEDRKTPRALVKAKPESHDRPDPPPGHSNALSADQAPAPNAKDHLPAPEPPAKAVGRRSQAEPADDDVTRLMSKVETELDNPEGASRRLALVRLRGAVAASQRGDDIDPAVAREAQHQVYRADLQEAVNPRSASRANSTSGPPGPGNPEGNPLPLKPAQRMDASPLKANQALTAQEARQGSTPNADFSAFVAETGAQSLADLVEAAASFIHHMSQEEGFSRRQVISKVRAISGPRFSPDKALLAFGQLVSAGKIRECAPAVFTASEHIRFRPTKTHVG